VCRNAIVRAISFFYFTDKGSLYIGLLPAEGKTTAVIANFYRFVVFEIASR